MKSNLSDEQIDLTHVHVILLSTSYYANTPMYYTAIFHGCKSDNFQMKNCHSFLNFAQNIDCGYTLEPHH